MTIMRLLPAVTLLLALALPPAVAGQTKSIELPPDNAYGDLQPGPGVEVTQRACRACHSTDYVVMQPRGDAKQWDGVVTKMMKVFGASIPPEDARTIVQYLSTHYGQ
jgi:sulfite dehydrogenase (cytochrome) subunit B